jgi:hypothetical protein
MVLRQGDAPVVQGGMTIVDDTMGGAGLVLPVISGVTPSFVDAADTGMTMTLRGYNLLEPSDEPVAMRDKPRLFINRVEIDPNDITAVNPFTLQFPIPSHPEGTIADLDFVAPWGSRTELGRITYRSGLAFSCRSGSVNANALNEDPNSPYSLSLDVLFINGQSGDANNEMTLTLEDFIQISVRRPPSIPLVQPVAYTLYAHFGPPPFGPTELTAVTQPNMRGCSCFPLLMGQGAPQPRKVLSGMIPATREEKMLLLSPIRLCTKLGQLGPQNIFFQLVIQDQYSNDMSMDPRSVSNGILLRVTNPNPNPCQ